MTWSNRLSLLFQPRSKERTIRSLRHSLTRLHAAFLLVSLLAVGGGAAFAQEAANPLPDVTLPQESAAVRNQQPAVLGSFVILDPERLFAETAYGLRVQEDLKTLAQEIQAENGKLTRDLETEELRLLEQRALLAPEEFREIADAFDEKVQGIRDAQERKGQELSRLASEGRQSFNEASLPILKTILTERNALGILDSRVILLPDPSIDITNEAILRVDQALKDGNP